jgi:tRNA pseudouridine55 synthase
VSPTPATAGLVVVDKPAGLTSHDVVARVRRLAGTRKVGHAGTLDPMATGVLVLGVERATRLLGHLLLTDKVYDATIRLGASTTTDDAEGEVTARASTDHLTEESLLTALSSFVGEIDQVPSTVSAIKVDGRRAYERVRAGEQVELAARRVRVDSIEVHRTQRDGGHLDVDVSVGCSSGTYIRALARDLGEQLGTGGHLTALRRTAVGPFTLDHARTLEELAEDFGVLPIAEAARTGFPAVDLDEGRATDVRFGRKLQVDLGASGPVALFAPDGEFLALYEQAGELARAVAVFV